MTDLPIIERCTGHCCRQFYLPFTHDEAMLRYQAMLFGDQDLPWSEDIETIYPMLIPLAVKELNGIPCEGRIFTCKNLRDDGNCAIYTKRPKMCSDYPYGRQCRYDDCTWLDAHAYQERCLSDRGGYAAVEQE